MRFDRRLRDVKLVCNGLVPETVCDQFKHFELMAGLTHKRNVATVMVTHDRSQLARVDTVYEMNDGVLEAMTLSFATATM
jgi:energy-coupling factor transporter ATP-binding protein EcfA2